ncbi:uncharacterized protein K02A2.6-like [Exaiptasia diaphana]|uniref:Uncharacterized protein n=1 Tax=Exaiptasia diaphana TaxID=2652724 RepID=A0A913YS03_EXADI|nr:uncharacterized protein K02A2.6-like [Exaiptasia diaphana]
MNGLAERYVGHFKKKTTQMKANEEPLQERLDKFLFTYRITPTIVGKKRFDLLRQRSMELKQQVKIFQDNSDFEAEFKPNQAVFVMNFGKGGKWLPGVVLKEISLRNYEVQVEDFIWKRHCTQMRSSKSSRQCRHNSKIARQAYRGHKSL